MAGWRGIGGRRWRWAEDLNKGSGGLGLWDRRGIGATVGVGGVRCVVRQCVGGVFRATHARTEVYQLTDPHRCVALRCAPLEQ